MNIGQLSYLHSYLSTYPLISHFSLSKPLCMDWPIEFSMRSTYLMTCGAKVSRICWWNFPFLRLSAIKLAVERSLVITISFLTISPEVVIEDLEEREGVPGVRVLEPEDGVHVHSEEWPEELTVLHQQVTEPRKRLGEKTNFSLEDSIPGSFTLH